MSSLEWGHGRFDSHANQAVSPALFDMGGLRTCTKSDLMGCLYRQIIALPTDIHGTSTKILDGTVVDNLLVPKGCKPFRDYTEKVFARCPEKNLFQQIVPIRVLYQHRMTWPPTVVHVTMNRLTLAD